MALSNGLADGGVASGAAHTRSARAPSSRDLPEEVSGLYPDVDQDLLRECRILVLAMVAASRWDPDDQLPNGQRAARELLGAVREGPPWPALDTVMRRLGDR
jgi:hypothetical protein